MKRWIREFFAAKPIEIRPASEKKRRIYGDGYTKRTRDTVYRAWIMARQRCNNPNATGYFRYGGRGILFKFNTFEDFYKELGPRPDPSYSVDRIDVNGHYEPGNIRWADKKLQAINRRFTCAPDRT